MNDKIVSIVSKKPVVEQPAKFTRGDVVKLRSGGHPFTIRAYENKKYVVDWISDNGEPMTGDYHHEMLVLAPEELQIEVEFEAEDAAK